ncbi:MAG: VOC family protein [Stenomitos frigidus ULC029]
MQKSCCLIWHNAVLARCGGVVSDRASPSSYSRFTRKAGITMPITGLNHAVLFVRDLERSIDFYKTVLGFIEVDRVQNQMGFLRAAASNNHHDLGLIAIGAKAVTPKPGTVGLYHLAWQVPTIEDLVS